MKTRNLFMNILGIFIGVIVAGTVAPAATITVLETFDFPGGIFTFPQKINDNGLIVGSVFHYKGVHGVNKGFLRARSGNFSDAFSDPNDTGNSTIGHGINNAKVVVGEYSDRRTGIHGYRLFHGIFTNYDAPNSSGTTVLGINNVGDFCGGLVTNGIEVGFLNLSGNVIRFAVPDAIDTFAFQLNSSNQAVGFYIVFDGARYIEHGYLRASDGTLTFPVDPTGSTDTELLGNNDANWVVGRYTDSVGIIHGLFFKTPDDIRTFDFPGATGYTEISGINQNGYVCGSYLDSAGIHGFLGIIGSGGTDQPNQSKSSVTPVKPAYPVRVGAPGI